MEQTAIRNLPEDHCCWHYGSALHVITTCRSEARATTAGHEEVPMPAARWAADSGHDTDFIELSSA